MPARRPVALASLATLLAVSACGPRNGRSSERVVPAAPVAVSISGAGASFPAPVYAKWAEGYHAQTGRAVNYQPIGSGGGIRQIETGAVDFGGSDRPLTPDELDKAGLSQFPTVVGGVVPILDVPGVAAGQVKLSGPLLADIYLGGVTTWNDPRLTRLNPGVKLPDLPITVVHRSDGSGASFLFTSYLSAVSPAWRRKVGGGDDVAWPTGVGGKGNDGVAAQVRQTIGSIGYVEYAYARQNSLAYADLQARDGAFVAPTADNFAAAAAAADWTNAPGDHLLLLNQAGANAWPITGATFILMHRRQDHPDRAKAALAFFDWAYRSGDAQAQALDYAPLPAKVKAVVRGHWSAIAGPDGKPVYTPPTP